MPAYLDGVNVAGLPAGGTNYGQCIPVVYGRTRVTLSPFFAPSFLWHIYRGNPDDQENAQDSYRQGLAALICEGPILGVGRAWKRGDASPDLAHIEQIYPFQLFTGTTPQTPWSFLSSGTMEDIHSVWLDIPNTAPYSAEIPPDETFDLRTAQWCEHLNVSSGVHLPGDADFMQPFYQVATITDSTHYTLNGRVLTVHESFHGWKIRFSWRYSVDLSGYSRPYDGIAYIASEALGCDYQNALPQLEVEVKSTADGDVNPADIIPDILSRIGVPGTMVDCETGPDGLAASGLRRWCAQTGTLISPAFTEQKACSEHLDDLLGVIGATAVWSEGKLRFVPLGESTVGTYAPQTTSCADLTNDHFLTEDGPPVLVSHVAPQDVFNTLEVRYTEGNPESGLGVYKEQTQTYSDSTDIAARGTIKGSQVDALCITSGPLAKRVAQFLTERQLRKTATYSFTLGAQFMFLEPGDLVTLTETGLGLSSVAVRLLTKSESSDGRLSFTAETWSGLAYPSTTTVETGYNAPPAQVSAPPQEANMPSMSLSADGRTVYLAASGAAKDFGGCEVWTSYDNATFTFRASLGPACHGQLTAQLLAGAAVDAANTLAVDVTASRRLLPATGEVIVGQERIAYGSRSGSAGVYSLTSLRRGIAGTWSVAHDSGTSFMLVDSNVLELDVAGHEGGTLYVKLVPFNISGQKTGSLASAVAWSMPIPDSRTAAVAGQLPWSDGFDAFRIDDWEVVSSQKGVLSLSETGESGGVALRCAGEMTLMSRALVPVDVAKILSARCRWRQVTAGSTSLFGWGFMGVEAGGQDLLDADGGGGFYRGQYGASGTVGAWQDVTRYWSGETDTAGDGVDGSADITDPGHFVSATGAGRAVRYVRVVLAYNQGAGATGVQEIDLVALSEAISGSVIVPYSVPSQAFAGGSVTVNALANGSVSAAKLADGAVSATKLLDGAVQTAKLADNCVIAGKVAAGAIGADQIAANAITAAKVSAGAIGADQLAANSVVAGKIAADAVTVNNIQAGSATLDRLSVGLISDNLWPNPTSENAPPSGAVSSKPVTNGGYTEALDVASEFYGRYGTASAYSGGYVRRISGGASGQRLGLLIPAQPGDSFYNSAQARVISGSGTLNASVNFWDASGAPLTVTNHLAGSSSGSWSAVSDWRTAPAGTVLAALWLVVPAGVVAEFDKLYARRMVDGSVVMDLSTANYAEDGSGNPTAGGKVDCRGTAIKVAPGNLQVGKSLLSALLQAKIYGGANLNGSGGINLATGLGLTGIDSVERIAVGGMNLPAYALQFTFSASLVSEVAFPVLTSAYAGGAFVPRFLWFTGPEGARTGAVVGVQNSSLGWADPASAYVWFYFTVFGLLD